MFMRLLNLSAKSSDMEALRSFYDAVVFGELQKIDGCLFAGLLQSNKDANEGISLTLWDSRDHADAYEKSGTYKKLWEEAKPFRSESAEWKIQLSEDLELEYRQDDDEPELAQFNVTVHERTKRDMFKQHSKMYIRIVSHILQKDKVDDFRDIYIDEIIPALRETNGCQYAYLIEGMNKANEVISLTIWDSKKDAKRYEKSGLFLELVNKLRPTFSQFYQWKMALDKDSEKRISTSDDLKVSDYQVVTGRNLRKSFPEHR